jgi:hypothetical protein
MKIVFLAVSVFMLALGAYAQPPKSHWAEFEKNKVHYYDIGGSKDKKALVLSTDGPAAPIFGKRITTPFRVTA